MGNRGRRDGGSDSVQEAPAIHKRSAYVIQFCGGAAKVA
jgi:hypothetical protein